MKDVHRSISNVINGKYHLLDLPPMNNFHVERMFRFNVEDSIDLIASEFVD
jgi:hypothetical protein